MEFAGLKSLTLLMDMLSTIVEAYLFAVQSSARNSIDNRPAKIKSMKAKRKLVDLVEARDAAGAEALWKSYLEISRSILLRWQPREGMRALSEFFFAQPR
jgi:DNA-binding FadR family transcriptional regulator